MFQLLIFIVNNCYFNSHWIDGALEDFFLVLFISSVNDFPRFWRHFRKSAVYGIRCQTTNQSFSRKKFLSLCSIVKNQIRGDERSCVCKSCTPKEVRESPCLIFTKWLQCDQCKHWVHLIYTLLKSVWSGKEMYFYDPSARVLVFI
jgi:hypothetical protein